MSAEVVPCRLVELVCRSTELLVTIVAQYIKSRVPEQHMSGQFRDGNRIFVAMSARNFHVMSSDLVLSQLLNRIETAVTLFTGIRTFVLGQKELEAFICAATRRARASRALLR